MAAGQKISVKVSSNRLTKENSTSLIHLNSWCQWHLQPKLSLQGRYHVKTVYSNCFDLLKICDFFTQAKFTNKSETCLT
jgi:hypothetical protein